ncbi:MAG: hypothetical protein OXI16_03075 [Chloroflexota bacterium]|nr:hypothetical protein [Chloroflexota bacterium]
MAQIAHGNRDTEKEGNSDGEECEVRGIERLEGTLQALTLEYAVIDVRNVAGHGEENRWISAHCETRCADADELHRKERSALLLT